MNERRTGDRHPPSIQLEVFNPLRRQKLGTLVDLGRGGVQIQSNIRLTMEEESIYWVRLPAGIGKRRWIALSARVVWRRPNRQEGGFSHGLQTAESCRDQLQRLLKHTVDEQFTADSHKAAPESDHPHHFSRGYPAQKTTRESAGRPPS